MTPLTTDQLATIAAAAGAVRSTDWVLEDRTTLVCNFDSEVHIQLLTVNGTQWPKPDNGLGERFREERGAVARFLVTAPPQIVLDLTTEVEVLRTAQADPRKAALQAAAKELCTWCARVGQVTPEGFTIEPAEQQIDGWYHDLDGKGLPEDGDPEVCDASTLHILIAELRAATPVASDRRLRALLEQEQTRLSWLALHEGDADADRRAMEIERELARPAAVATDWEGLVQAWVEAERRVDILIAMRSGGPEMDEALDAHSQAAEAMRAAVPEESTDAA